MGKLQRRQKNNYRTHKRVAREIMAEVEPEPRPIPESRSSLMTMVKCKKCNIALPSSRALMVHKKSAMHKRAAMNAMNLEKKEDELLIGMDSLVM